MLEKMVGYIKTGKIYVLIVNVKSPGKVGELCL